MFSPVSFALLASSRNVGYFLECFLRWVILPAVALVIGALPFFLRSNTYRKGIEMGMKPAGFGKEIKNYVSSRQAQESLERGVEFISEPIKTFAQRLRSQPGKDIWMMGGGGIIGSFLDEREIDEFIIHVVPIFIGAGIPLIEARHRAVPLKLVSCRSYPDGVARLHYSI